MMPRADDGVYADVFEDFDPCACPVCGRESCEDHLPPNAEPATGEAKRPRLPVLRAADMIALPSPVEIIEGILWQGCITMLPAESGSGKTFVALDLGAAVSEGTPWHGRRTLPRSVVYVPFESDNLPARFEALHQQGYSLRHLHVIRASEPISPRVTREGEVPSPGERLITDTLIALRDDLAANGEPPIGPVIIDTARASMLGPEDSSEHVSAYTRAGRRILAAVPDAGLFITHHTGWQDGGDTQRKRERGSSAWRGNVEGTVYLEAGEYDPHTGECPLTLRTLKVRDGEKPAPLHLIRRRVEVRDRFTRYGEPVTSCIIASDPRTREDRDAEHRQAVAAAHRLTALAVLRAMRDYPSATSISKIRPYVNRRTEDVSEAVSYILRAGWAVEGERGKPYTLTPDGLHQLAEDTP
jgi:hypothetical protein